MGNQNSGMVKDDLEGRDVRQLDKNVSAALAKGVKYNMKILIRGQVVDPRCAALGGSQWCDKSSLPESLIQTCIVRVWWAYARLS